jgi:hypothetical protein
LKPVDRRDYLARSLFYTKDVLTPTLVYRFSKLGELLLSDACGKAQAATATNLPRVKFNGREV